MTPVQMSATMPFYIALEVAKDFMALISVLLVLWIIGLGLAFFRRGSGAFCQRQPWFLSLVVGGIVTLLAFVLAPGLTASGFSMMKGWLDWAGLFGLALGVGVAGVVLVYPWLRAFVGRPTR